MSALKANMRVVDNRHARVPEEADEHELDYYEKIRKPAVCPWELGVSSPTVIVRFRWRFWERERSAILVKEVGVTAGKGLKRLKADAAREATLRRTVWPGR